MTGSFGVETCRKPTEDARLAGMENKTFPEKMKRHPVTLDAFKTSPPENFN